MQVCSGLPISQGLAAGKIVFLGAQKAAVRQAGSPQEEQLRFESAQRQAVDALGALYEKARAELGEKDAEIFSVHQLMAEDEDFTDLVSEAIADGAEASEAVRQAGAQPCFPAWTTIICVNAPPMCGTSPPASAAF